MQEHKALVRELASAGEEKDKKSELWSSSMEAREKNLQAAVGERTGQGYHYWWSRFVEFCKKTGMEPMPFSTTMVSAFLSDLAEKSSGLGGVAGARAALGHYWGIKHPDISSPTESAEVRAVIHGIKRRFQLPVKKREALSVEDFCKILWHVTEGGQLEELGLVALRLAAQVAVLYCTFARFEEVQALKVEQVKIGEVDLVVEFMKGKTYQYGESRLGAMPAQPQLAVDPVAVVKVYVRRLGELGAAGSSWLFPTLSALNGKLRILPKAASYGAVRKQFKAALEGAGVSGKVADYGLHSMRRGAASGAVNNGCDDHTVMKQMRVSSTATVQRYATVKKGKLAAAVNVLFGQSE